MIEGTNSLFTFFSNFKVSLLNIPDNITHSLENLNPFHSTTISDLVSPDVLFLDNQKSRQSGENFSFLDNYQLPSLGINKNIIGKSRYLAGERLKQVTPQELKNLGANN